jgi:hypothetical protein
MRRVLLHERRNYLLITDAVKFASERILITLGPGLWPRSRSSIVIRSRFLMVDSRAEIGRVRCQPHRLQHVRRGVSLVLSPTGSTPRVAHRESHRRKKQLII